MEGTRSERRRGSRRARTRVSWAKTDKFLRLRQRGVPRGVMASILGMSPATIAELEAIAEEGEGNR